MKNLLIYVLLSITGILVLLSGCGASEVNTPEPIPTAPIVNEMPTARPTPVPQVYPAPEAVEPAAPTLDPDYPAPPTDVPTVDPYPGGLAWVIRPVGIQCEDGTAPGYGDLREATSTLTAAGVKVAQSEMTELVVTDVCGAPTSAHFRVQIAASDLQTVLSLGWTQE
ncbi:MAG: hypothetical protein ACK2T4_09065 [Candidatus Promineifilaceae bacterium]|jgi:hypothetical protein